MLGMAGTKRKSESDDTSPGKAKQQKQEGDAVILVMSESTPSQLAPTMPSVTEDAIGSSARTKALCTATAAPPPKPPITNETPNGISSSSLKTTTTTTSDAVEATAAAIDKQIEISEPASINGPAARFATKAKSVMNGTSPAVEFERSEVNGEPRRDEEDVVKKGVLENDVSASLDVEPTPVKRLQSNGIAWFLVFALALLISGLVAFTLQQDMNYTMQVFRLEEQVSELQDQLQRAKLSSRDEDSDDLFSINEVDELKQRLRDALKEARLLQREKVGLLAEFDAQLQRLQHRR